MYAPDKTRLPLPRPMAIKAIKGMTVALRSVDTVIHYPGQDSKDCKKYRRKIEQSRREQRQSAYPRTTHAQTLMWPMHATSC
ncbi:hypothetical protein BT63DRAFT_96978 [Microthyrium microscopicum]|uniref:Uncharacterized protein n=1 Tax=Microthyrium microscopicum TaxID=703497 RepID=A0A6A6U0U8_9PEZI|nr:hypothetical protein BT63DRAFT_96978 [Microthyrium microscopicum]